MMQLDGFAKQILKKKWYSEVVYMADPSHNITPAVRCAPDI